MPKSDSTKAARWRFFVLLAFACCVTLATWAAEAQRVASVQISAEQITWDPVVGAERWLLTVSGQGIYLRETYQGGEMPSLRPIAPDGEWLADGSYKWELRAIKSEQNALADRGEADRERPLGVDTGRGTFELRIDPKPVVTSGSFLVQGGSFVDPWVEAEDREHCRPYPGRRYQSALGDPDRSEPFA